MILIQEWSLLNVAGLAFVSALRLELRQMRIGPNLASHQSVPTRNIVVSFSPNSVLRCMLTTPSPRALHGIAFGPGKELRFATPADTIEFPWSS